MSETGPTSWLGITKSKRHEKRSVAKNCGFKSHFQLQFKVEVFACQFPFCGLFLSSGQKNSSQFDDKFQGFPCAGTGIKILRFRCSTLALCCFINFMMFWVKRKDIPGRVRFRGSSVLPWCLCASTEKFVCGVFPCLTITRWTCGLVLFCVSLFSVFYSSLMNNFNVLEAKPSNLAWRPIT